MTQDDQPQRQPHHSEWAAWQRDEFGPASETLRVQAHHMRELLAHPGYAMLLKGIAKQKEALSRELTGRRIPTYQEYAAITGCLRAYELVEQFGPTLLVVSQQAAEDAEQAAQDHAAAGGEEA